MFNSKLEFCLSVYQIYINPSLVFITSSVKVIVMISSRNVLCTYSLSLSLLDMSHNFCFFRPFSGVFLSSSDELEEGS